MRARHIARRLLLLIFFIVPLCIIANGKPWIKRDFNHSGRVKIVIEHSCRFYVLLEGMQVCRKQLAVKAVPFHALRCVHGFRIQRKLLFTALNIVLQHLANRRPMALHPFINIVLRAKSIICCANAFGGAGAHIAWHKRVYRDGFIERIERKRWRELFCLKCAIKRKKAFCKVTPCCAVKRFAGGLFRYTRGERSSHCGSKAKKRARKPLINASPL